MSLLANLGKGSQCLRCPGGERGVLAYPEPLAVVPGSAVQNVLGLLVPTQHLALVQGPSWAPRCHHWGSPVPYQQSTPLLGPEREAAVPAGSGGFCHGDSPQLLLGTPQLGLLPAAIQGL